MMLANPYSLYYHIILVLMTILSEVKNIKKMKLSFKGQKVESYIYCSDSNRLVIAVVHPEKVVHDLLFMYNRFESLNARLRLYKAMKRKYEQPKCSEACCCQKF